MKIIFACGGTGGHIFPAIAIAQAFLKKIKKNIKIFFIGSDTGMEKEIIKKYKFEFISITARPFLRKISVKNIINFFLIMKAILNSMKIIKKINPDYIIGTGGYVSFPIVLSGVLLYKKVFIHEPNIFPGLANRILGRFVSGITAGFEFTEKYFSKEKIFITGNPVRQDILNVNKNIAIKKLKLKKNKNTILIMPGSRAAHSINLMILNSLNDILKELKNLQIIWMTGNKDYKFVKENVKNYKNIKIFKFINNVGYAYSASNAGILRAGASTLTEIITLKYPAILIPYPYATGNHQEKNAEIFKKNSMAIVINERELTKDILIKNLKLILDNKTNQEIRKKLGKIKMENNAEKICETILKAG